MKSGGFGRLVGVKRWRIAEHIFERYQGGAIFFGRSQALLRALVPALAGMHKVPYRTFLKWNAAGGFLFSTIIVLLGYEFASTLPQLEKYLRYWAIFALLVAVTVVILVKRKVEKSFEN